MSKTIQEYLDWLDERDDLRWPRPPAPKPLKATPYLKPLAGIRAVTFSVYGTLLRIDAGQLFHIHPQPLRMQIALEKTIEEFNMWNSMSRKPGQPWEYMLQQYTRLVEEERMTSGTQKGGTPEIASERIWGKLIERLIRNEYQYDQGFYGDVDELAEKVAYFFHASLQGVEATDGALATLQSLSSAGLSAGLLADAQVFTLAQLLRALRGQGTIPSLGDLFASDSITLSHSLRLRKPSPGLFTAAAERFRQMGIEPHEVLHVSHRLQDDLSVARQTGFRTALLAADAVCCQVSAADVRQAEVKPDRLLTKLSQVRHLLQI
ncbi:MAG: HAD family hydrolase [Maioricimonas sp. JB045]|uniref:HAD family hydrolase n=1 Tax=Maioricimonas sp. JC845 TaxID=3232138 RepID=UPI00345A08EB